MKSPEQMGGPPEQPKEEPMKDKEGTLEKSTSPESYNEAEWKKLKQGGAAFAINKGKEIGVPQEELDRFAEDVITRETESQNYVFVYRFRKNMGIGTEEEIRAAGERAYKFFLESGESGSAMSVAEDMYGRDSEEWRRANEANEAEWKKKEERRKRKEEEMEEMKDEERELEKKITTPEEAAEMTWQRRKEFGLEEKRELTPEETKKLEESIERLLHELDKYDFESCSPEIQEEWYWVEQEAGAGKDRELAEANLKRFLKVLQKETKRPGD